MKSPALLLLIVLALVNITDVRNGSPMDWIMSKLMMLPAIVIGFSFHEFAHAIASNALGDPTPKLQGRLTINPGAHFDPFGFIALLFVGFGWGRPVEINPGYYKHRRSAELIVSLAGVTMNFILAIVFAFALKFVVMSNPDWIYSDMGQIIWELGVNVIRINLVLLVFNLLPVPPLDGFGILTEIFNLRKYNWYYTVYNNGFMILLLLIIFNVTDYILTPILSFLFGGIMEMVVF